MAGDPFRLDGRVALVTGASRGLGAAMASALAGAGADVVLHASREAASATERAIRRRTGRTRTKPVVADLSDRRAADRLVPAAIEAFGRLDILVNNAGIIRRAPAAELHRRRLGRGDRGQSDERVPPVPRGRRGTCSSARLAARSSTWRRCSSFQGGITVPAYAAAKGGVAQLTKALANEWAGRGVNVNAIAPGLHAHRQHARAAATIRRGRGRSSSAFRPAGGASRRISAGAVVFLASPAADYVNGHVLVVDGGWMGR